MERTCVVCNAKYDAARRDSKTCGAACRQRHSRGAARTPEISALPTPTEVDPEPLVGLDVIARELQRQLLSSQTPPSSKAALARELRSTLALIEAALPRVKGVVDELLERRSRRTGSAGA